MQPQQRPVQVNVDSKEAKGAYSNLMQVQHSQEEFCLDFFSIFPPFGALTARVIVSPGHLKRMINALQESLKKYEGAHGNVTVAEAPQEPQFGFKAN